MSSAAIKLVRPGASALIVVAIATLTSVSFGQAERSRFATEDSRSDYVHRIELYDSRNTLIRPNSDRPYSPSRTCGRCHDVAAISHGFHFSVDPNVQAHGRPGEPWIWVDPTTGTQLPLSYRGWKNSYSPDDLGISPWDFTLRFGKRTAGGYPGLPADADPADSDGSENNADEANDRFHVSGPLEVDCMICHARDSTFDLEAWSKQIDEQNFSWASTVAIGLAKVDGAVRRLPDDFDVASANEEGSAKSAYPTTSYEPGRFDAEGNVFLDIVRTPSNNACYRCHSTLVVGAGSSPVWTHEDDVHLRAGLKCADCHPNALGHVTVRGFEGEVHPEQEYAASLSCRGCHMGPASEGSSHEFSSGRLGAPYPEHRGLPAIHFERLSCTACHSGSLPEEEAHLAHTSRNHFLGEKGHRHDHQQPEIVEPVLLPDGEGKLYPHRVMWPSYWGSKDNDVIVPLEPNDVQEALKRVLRARRDFLTELTRIPLTTHQKTQVLGEERATVRPADLTPDEQSKLSKLQDVEGRRAFNEKLRKALVQLKQAENIANPVYIAGEKIYQLDGDSQLEIVDNPQAKPYAWPIAHDVRPARWSLGANGCTDCHAADSPFLYADVTAEAAVPAEDLKSRPMYDYANVDDALWNVWHESLRAKPLLLWTLAGSSLCLIGVMFVRSVATIARIPRRTEPEPAVAPIVRPWSVREKLIYGGFVVTVALLGVTSLTPFLRTGSVHGWWLVAHMFAAGAYLGFAVLMAVFVSRRFSAGRQMPESRPSLLASRVYWLMLLLSLAVTITALSTMLPVLGTRDLARAITLHRYCGIGLLAVTLVHVLLVALNSRRESGAEAT